MASPSPILLRSLSDLLVTPRSGTKHDQPALTISASPCLDEWNLVCESHSRRLELVDSTRVKEIRGSKAFQDLFHAWKHSIFPNKQKAYLLVEPIPDSLQVFEDHVCSVFLHDSVDISHLRGMLFVALEAADGHVTVRPPVMDSRDVLVRTSEMFADVSQKLQLLSALGVVGSIPQQRALTRLNDKLLGFLEQVILSLRAGPIDDLTHQEWLRVEEQYTQAISSFENTYALLKELQSQKGSSRSQKGSPRERTPSTSEGQEISVPSHCMMLPARNSRFFARKDIMKQIQDRLDAQVQSRIKSIVLYGLGGVGKTEIAREYAYEAEDSLNTILWIRSNTAGILAESFTYAAMRLDLPGAMPQEDAKNRELVLGWLSRTTQKWLIVYDNAENPDQLQKYWPSSGNGSIIVTTRHKNIFFDMTQAELQIEPFSEDEGAECLLSLLIEERDVPPDRTAATQLSQQLGGLPLGISQLAAFTRTRQLTLETCAKLYGQRKRRMHTDTNARYSEYKQDLTTVWAMQFQTLNEHPDSRALLGVLTFLSPDSVQENLFNLPWDLEDPQIPESILFCKDEMDLSDAERLLLALSLILKSPHSKDLSLHRLVQVEFEYSMSPTERQKAFDAASYLLSRRFPKHQGRRLHDVWGLCKIWVAHVLSLSNHYIDGNRGLPCLEASIHFCYVVSDCAWYLYEIADYKTLEVVIAGCRKACKKLGDDPEAQRVYANLCIQEGIAYENRGFFDEALALHEECLDYRKKLLGESNISDLASCYRRLSMIYESNGNIDKYYECRKEAWNTIEMLPPSTKPPYWVIERNSILARILIRQGEYADAEKFLQELLQRFEKSSTWYTTARIYFAYGNLHLARHDYDQSFTSFLTAKRHAKTAGNSAIHPDKLACIYKLGRVALARDDIPTAIVQFRKALAKLDLTTMIESHRARVCFMLSETLAVPGPNQNFEEAGKLRKEAVEIFRMMRPKVAIPQNLTEDMFDGLICGELR